MKKSMKSVIRMVVLVLVAGVIGVNLYAFNSSRLLGEDVPMPFGVGAAVVLSGSMEPTISAGDLLVIVERERYEVEDVIVFGDGRTSVTHRIIRMNEDEVVTRGDANNTEDTPITYKQIKGEVVLAIPLVGYLLNAIKSPVGTIVILGLAIFLGERSFRKDKRRDEETLDQIKAEIDRLKQQQDK